MRDLAIFGAGGHARDVLQIVRVLNRAAPRWHCLGFVVDPGYPAPASLQDLPVIVGIEALVGRSTVDVVVAVADPRGRQGIVERLARHPNLSFPTLIDPRGVVGEHVKLGEGTVVMAGAVISTDLELGAHVLVNVTATIGHDCRIGPFSTLGPGVNLGGGVKIGARVQIGMGAALIPNVEVGDDCIIGAGTAVIRSLPAGVTAVGVPARILRPHDPPPAPID